MVTASTGVAACNIGGVTLHSFAAGEEGEESGEGRNSIGRDEEMGEFGEIQLYIEKKGRK